MSPARRRFLFCLSLAGMAGCAAPPLVDPGARPLLRLPPATLGRSLALQQQLLVHAGGQSRRIEVLLEADQQSVRLALMNLGQTMARLQWDGHELVQTSAPGWPRAVSGERVLSDLQLALWPADAIAAALPADWTLEQLDGRRLLRRGDQIAATVDYPSSSRIELVDRQHGYRLEIESRTLGTTP